MEKRNKMVLVVPLLISLSCSNSYPWGNQPTPAQSFVTGVCAVGAAVIGAVGAVALADWCFSETDDQMMARFEREISTFDAQYHGMMSYVEQSLGIYAFPVDCERIYRNSSEIVLYEVATRIGNSGASQSVYRSNIFLAKNQLQSSMSKLYKRIHALERKNCNYDEQRRLHAMRGLSQRAQALIGRATFFADYLEHHKGYFNLYGIVSELRNSYVDGLAVAEQAGMYAENNLKYGILSVYGGRYPFRTFVNTVESDIARLRSGINALAYHYDGKHYASTMLNQLMWMKNVITADYRYTQECYQFEQERLQKLQLEAMRAQARAERERADALREQNRILQQNNYLKQQELWQRQQYNPCGSYNRPDIDVEVVITL